MKTNLGKSNLGKSKEEIVYELLISLNKGNSGYAGERVQAALDQYNKLVRAGIIK